MISKNLIMLKEKNKIIQILSANKKHLDSSLFLFLINIFNFIFPLLLLPIIISRCSIEGFGIITLFQSIMLFVSSITDYGFNINATQTVIINQYDNLFVNIFFFEISYTKTILLIVSLILAFVIYIYFPQAKEHSLIYFSSLAILIGRAYNPLWVLRAIHKMKFIFYFYLFFKILCILLIYFLLRNSDDLYLVNLFIGFSDLLTCIFATFFLFFYFKWKFILPLISQIIHQIFSGFSIFIQNTSINANAYLNPVILGVFVDPYTLGIYCVVEKIILIIKFCASFIQQSVFPKACELLLTNKFEFNRFMKFLQFFLILCMILVAFCLNLFPDIIVSYFIKKDILICSNLLIFNSWIPLIVSLNMVPYLTFIVYKKQKPLTIIIAFSVLLNMTLNTLLSKSYGIYGISIGIYITEFFISISLWLLMIFKYPKYNFLRNDE